MSSEAQVAKHYTRGSLEETIFRALAESGKDPETLVPADLAPVDEFHVGGLSSTQELAAQMELRPDLHLLDVGCGLGGPARYLASEHSCRVTGVDLSEEFVQVARSLTRLVKLDHVVEFRHSSALHLPFDSQVFDRAYMIHVGMNIGDKAAAYREVRRVLKTGGLFVVFDILRIADGPIRFPVPWAMSQETSFVADVTGYRNALQVAGFRITLERSRRAFAIDFTERTMARMAQTAPPALGLHLLLGDKMPQMAKNILAMMQEGLLEPVELFARAD
jgi:ubiquinone/menaquinone biosynthesis C-methylase UbiE